MNHAAIFERVIAEYLMRTCELGTGARIRTFFSPRVSADWSEENDRAFPCVSIVCSPPAQDEQTLASYTCDVSILLVTDADADRDAKVISSMLSEVSDAVMRLTQQWRDGSGTEWNRFLDILATDTDNTNDSIRIGGITLSSPTAPSLDDHTRTVGLAVRIHFVENKNITKGESHAI